MRVKGSRSPKGMVICCLDYRYIAATLLWAKRQGLTLVDMKTDAGGIKTLLSEGSHIKRWILKNIRLATERHKLNTVLLINHQDCAGYGGSKAFNGRNQEQRSHSLELARAKKLLESKFRKLKVRTFYAHQGRNKIVFEEF